MVLRIIAIFMIYGAAALAWIGLGGSVMQRTYSQDSQLRGAVENLWGSAQRQEAPRFFYETSYEKKFDRARGGEIVTETRTVTEEHALPLTGSDIDVGLELEHRRKGLLWYSTYRVRFQGRYRVVNTTGTARKILFKFKFPDQASIYDDFRLLIGENESNDPSIEAGELKADFFLPPGASREVTVSYFSRGLDEWWYDFGRDVNQVRNFNLTMTTDFDRIDFPQGGISPTGKEKLESGRRLTWSYKNLLTGARIGLSLPRKLNPGPWVGQVSFSAPISLFMFFFLLFIFTTVKNIKIHPMNYVFIAAAFFSFHLLLAYLVDHVSIHAAFLLASVVSIALVASYMRLVVDSRPAFLEIAAAQFVYLVLFSYTFFFKGYTGLSITILGIISLFVVMQVTGRVDWEDMFKKRSLK